MTRPGTQVLPRRWWALLLGAGVLLLVLGAVMAVTYSLAFVQRGETPGGLSLPFVDAYPTTTDVLLPPFGAFLVGGCLTFVGELLRRGAIVHGYGNNIALFRPLGLVMHAFWIMVPLAVWVAIVPLTLSKASVDQAASPSLSYLDSGSDVVFLLGVYGGLVAAVTGALVGSWVKKAWYLRTERRLGPPDPGTRSPGWWMFTYYWRADVWLVALGGLLLGIVPLPWFLGSTTAAVVTASVGVVLAVAGLASSTQYRRSGMPLGTGSSLTGGATDMPEQSPPARSNHRRASQEPVIPSLVLGVIGMNVFAVVLVVARARAFRRPLYKPMLLNIGLSILPVFVLLVGLVATFVALAGARSDSSEGPLHPVAITIAVVSALVWLLLLPNASYLITELNLSHRTDDDPTPLWYDIVLVITLAMSGVLNLVVNVLVVQVMYGVAMHPTDDVAGLTQPDTRLVAIAIIMLSAVGVYLGRYLRLNSWDVTHPASFVRKVRDHFSQTGAVKTFLGFTLVHTIFIALLYLTIGGTIIDLIVASQRSR